MYSLVISSSLSSEELTRSVGGLAHLADPGPVSRKCRKLFGPEKPLVKLRPPYSVKLVFSYAVKGIKIKITAKFRASRRLRFENTNRIMSPEMRPKSLGTFKKRAQVLRNGKSPWLKSNGSYGKEPTQIQELSRLSLSQDSQGYNSKMHTALNAVFPGSPL